MIATDPHFPGLSRIGALLADPGRAAMLWALMDGSARPAGELTRIAGLSPSAGSAHLARLTDGGLLTPEVRGRHRYYRIASPDVAAAIEALANLAQAAAPALPPRAPRPARTVPMEMRHARTCYDHMAGELAVLLYERMLDAGWLTAQTREVEVTPAGAAQFTRWRIDLGGERQRRRRFACTCLDWSERRAHLAGALGAALLDAFRAQRWVESAGKPRILRVTPEGRRQFERLLTGR
ncbi:ArsR/SmtB family transcription factor [Burkholderia plantarii]|uniref:ArsR/SmtB family transcription factor n=1 Tax=Burkholderia plantarii TaxID=41899 RepID=UPI0008706724|nr:metalloregulator ArsR/SmtB family transcription factor [Burkholderia plantarii]WLE58492.1 winged helix-turn-helix transcriptional regulator [Burkholderia plantarii]